MIQLAGIDASTSDNGFSLEFQTSRTELLAAFSSIADTRPQLLSLTALIEAKERRKYDQFLQPVQLDLCLADSALDRDAALKALQDLLSEINSR